MARKKPPLKQPHKPTKGQRDTVILHARVGTPQPIIAQVIGICETTLRKHYRAELDVSLHTANADVGGALYNKAINGDTTAQIFWLKTQAGMRERKEEPAPQDNNITINLVEHKPSGS